MNGTRLSHEQLQRSVHVKPSLARTEALWSKLSAGEAITLGTYVWRSRVRQTQLCLVVCDRLHVEVNLACARVLCMWTCIYLRGSWPCCVLAVGLRPVLAPALVLLSL